MTRTRTNALTPAKNGTTPSAPATIGQLAVETECRLNDLEDQLLALLSGLHDARRCTAEAVLHDDDAAVRRLLMNTCAWLDGLHRPLWTVASVLEAAESAALELI